MPLRTIVANADNKLLPGPLIMPKQAWKCQAKN